MGAWSVSLTVRYFDPCTKILFSVSVYMLAVHSFIKIETLNFACINNCEFAFIVFSLI